MSDLADFLLARIAEDATLIGDASWVDSPPGGHLSTVSDCDCNDDHSYSAYLAVDPARVLADLAAKKELVKRHAARDDCCEQRLGPMVFDAEPVVSVGADSWGGLISRRSIGHQEQVGCVTLMLLASVYADHPDYREEWRP